MPNLRTLYNAHKQLSADAQVQIAKAIPGAMEDKHEDFLAKLLALIEQKNIDPANTKSFLNAKIYSELSQTDKDQIDLALMNLGHMLEEIVQFRLSRATPNSAPQLQTMIDALWQMKSKIEEKVGDVFKF